MNARRLFLSALACLWLAAPAGAAEPWAQSHLLESQGEYAAAAALIEPLINNGRADEYALLRYGWLSYLQGNHNEAVRVYQRALSANPASLDARLGLTLPLMVQKRWNDARQQLRRALDQAPWQYTAHTRLMEVEEGLQEWDTLLQHTREFLKVYPSDATALVYQARAHLWLNDGQAAAVAYRKVLQRYPNHVEANAWLYGQK